MFDVYTIAYGAALPTRQSHHRTPTATARRLASFIHGKRADPAYYAIYALDDTGARWTLQELRNGVQRCPVQRGHMVRAYDNGLPEYCS